MIDYYYPQDNPNQYVNLGQQNHETPNSIRRLIKLPLPVPIPPQKKLFNTFCRSNKKQFEKLQNEFENVYNSLSHSFKYYENPSEYVFTFPTSRFPAVPPGSQNDISYQHNIRFEQQNTFRESLSNLQIQQISQRGQFEVMSENPLITLPYVWKINTCLFRGREGRYNIWINGLAYVYQLIIMAKNFLIKDIPEQLWSLTTIPKRFFSIFFGYKSLKTIYQDNPNMEVMKDFLQEVFVNLYSKNDQGWGRPFYEMLNIPFDSRISQVSKGTKQEKQFFEKLKLQLQQQANQLITRNQSYRTTFSKIDTLFQNNWAKQRKKIIKDIQQLTIQKIMRRPISESEQAQMIVEQNKQEIESQVMTALQQKKFNMYIQHVRQQLPKSQISNKVIQAIVFLLQFFNLLNNKTQSFTLRKSNARKNIQKQVKKNYEIRSLSYLFYSQQVARQQKKVYQEIDHDFYNGFAFDSDVKKILTPFQTKLYQIFLNYRNTLSQRLQRKKQQAKKIVVPSQVYTQYYYLLPPYQVQRNQDHYGNTYYRLIKQQSMSINTKNHCWKFWLYGMRLICWTKNCFVCAIYLAIRGPLGLMCLLPLKQFQYDEEINYTTGLKNSITRPTVIGVFLQVVKGAYQSRQAFQAQPDLGIFGKKFSRLCNLIQCYIFRIFFVGIIIVILLYPIVILINVILMLFLLITVWFWVPIAVAITYLFNINVYHFDDPSQRQQWSVRCLPIISSILKLLIVIIYVLYYLIRILVTPILCILVLLFYITRRVIRGLTDRIMMIFIWCLGRVPSQDSAIAWKISGPGMSKNYYMSIGIEDAILLTQAQMQKVLMQKLKVGLEKQINQLYQTYSHVMKKFLEPYVSTYNLRDNIIKTCTSSLISTLGTQYSNHIKRYPRNPYNVRFTQQQIDSYFDSSVKIVTKFVQKHGISDWIFEDFQTADNDYVQLTHKVWVRIFNCGQQIFEPLELIDKRFKLEDVAFESSSLSKKKHSIMLALDGQINLMPQKTRIQTFKLGLSGANPNIVSLIEILSNFEKNNYNRIYADFENVSYAFIPQLNIKEVKKSDIIQYEKTRQSYPQALNI